MLTIAPGNTVESVSYIPVSYLNNIIKHFQTQFLHACTYETPPILANLPERKCCGKFVPWLNWTTIGLSDTLMHGWKRLQ